MRLKVVLAALVVLALLLPEVSAEGSVVYVAKVEGMITGYTADQFDRYISEAEKNNAEAIIIQLNTPGGRSDAMQAIVTRIQSSKVPVIIYVYPSGGMAASAGTYIALSSHLIAMAPGTVIGACRPILGYGQNGSIVEAPPARAATLPRTARKTNDESATSTISRCTGANHAIPNGNAAPTKKDPADDKAACIGRALPSTEMPISSRACAPSASCFINCSATCCASRGSTPLCS